MIQESAKVVSVSGTGRIIVESSGQKACHRCANSGGCGISVLAKYFGAKRHQFSANSQIEVLAGDRVLLEIEKSALLFAAVLMYVLPLLVMIFSILFVQYGFGVSSEIIHIVVAFGGLAAGIMASRAISKMKYQAVRFEPVIVSHCLPGLEAGTSQQKISYK